MEAVESLITHTFATKEERATFAKESLGTHPANRPFYWKQCKDGKKLVWTANQYVVLANLNINLQLFQSDVITYTLSPHFKDVKNASTAILKLHPIGALILSIQAVLILPFSLIN
jgi:hypothetical protein